MRLLTLAIIFSASLDADIRTCSEANSLRADQWISNWMTHPEHGTLRKQAEAVAIILKLSRVDWAHIPAVEQIKKMSDRELDILGDGIRMQHLGVDDTLVQFSYHGSKYVELIFQRHSNLLSTRIYYRDGLCMIVKDFAFQYSNHLGRASEYSEW